LIAEKKYVGTIKNMKRIIITISLISVLALSACSSKSNDSINDSSNPSDTETTATANSNGIDSKDGSATGKSKAATPPTAAMPGSKATPNALAWKVVTDISATCAKALQPFRDFEDKHPDGLSREQYQTAAEQKEMNAAMTAVQSNTKICTKKEFDTWYNQEYLGWSRSSK